MGIHLVVQVAPAVTAVVVVAAASPVPIKEELRGAFTEMAALAVMIQLATVTAPRAAGVVLLLFFQVQVTLQLAILYLLPEAAGVEILELELHRQTLTVM